MVDYNKIISSLKGRIPVIIGPTAVGKTRFSINFSNKIESEIISIDSRQIYRDFIIGTSQPSCLEQKQAKHHLINVLNFNEIISAGKYLNLVDEKIGDLRSRDKTPILVGGTMLYIKLLCYGMIKIKNGHQGIREKLLKQIKQGELNYLYNKLKIIDPKYSEKVSLNDHKKLIRALEIFYITGRSPSEIYLDNEKDKINYRSNYFLIELKENNEILKEKIKLRTIKMFDKGWVKEVEKLLKKGVPKNCHPMQSVGYKEVIHLLENSISETETIDLISRKTWHYARKQLTWLRKIDTDLILEVNNINNDIN